MKMLRPLGNIPLLLVFKCISAYTSNVIPETTTANDCPFATGLSINTSLQADKQHFRSLQLPQYQPQETEESRVLLHEV